MLTPFLVLYLVLVALNLLDGFTTWKFVKPDHYGREANPIARWLFSKLRIPRGIIIVEGVTQALVTLFIFWLLARNPLLTKLLLGFGIMVFGWIVQGSFGLIKKLRERR